jgi:MerR family transcriptional regulator, redox-sensitive transcriptional activator SoxR
MRYLSIGELADTTRVRASALRYWEERGLLPGAFRQGGHRVWPATAIRRVALIKMAQRAGFTLTEITQLLDISTTPSATRQWRELATRKLPELDRDIAQMQTLRQAVADCLECGCMNFDQCELLAAADQAVR